MKTIQAKIPDQLYRQMETLVKEGWFRSHDDITDEALRRFLDSHRPELMEKFIREDVEWGLHGGTRMVPASTVPGLGSVVI